jgi:hypothetical protein
MAGLVRHRQTKGSATDRLRLNHRATPRLHRSKAILHIGVNAVNQDLSKDIIPIRIDQRGITP